ncbi:MAG: ferrous iron transport protein A [bacterium]|nr:ferrous iron transport protein A [bacterium]
MDDLKLLKDLKSGQKGIITKVSGGGSIFRRLLDMGIGKGAEITVVRVAPLGDPIEIKVRGYNLSLRKNEASNIYVDLKE